MALGELFDLDEIDKMGDPWHGLWDGVSNNIATIPGPSVACPGSAPDAGFPPRRHGDCYRIVVPGTPATSSDAADAAAGRTWLDYGLLSGFERRLYGVELGSKSWIYVASDGTRWLAEFTTLTADVDAGTADITLVLTEFGAFGAAAAPITQTFALGTVSLTLNAATPNDFLDFSASHAASFEIEDIWTDGSKVLIAPQIHCVAVDSPRIEARVLFTVLQAELSGIPPSANLNLTTVLTQAQVGPAVTDSFTRTVKHIMWVRETGNTDYTVYIVSDASATYDWTATLAASPPYDLYLTGDAATAYSGTYAQQVVIGVRYTASGVLSVIKREETHAHTYTATVTPDAAGDWAASSSDSNTGKISLTVDGTEIQAIPLNHSHSSSGTGSTLTWSMSFTIGSQTLNTSGSTGTFDLSPNVGSWYQPKKPGGINTVAYTQSNAYVFWPLKYTNTIFGMASEEIFSSPLSLRFYPVFGRVGSGAGEIVWTAGGLPVFCSEHPVDNTLVRGIVPVAYV